MDALDFALNGQSAPARPATPGGAVSTDPVQSTAIQPNQLTPAGGGDALDFALGAGAPAAAAPPQFDPIGFPIDEDYKAGQAKFVNDNFARKAHKSVLGSPEWTAEAQRYANEWHPTKAGLSVGGVLSGDFNAQVDTPITPQIAWEFVQKRAHPDFVAKYQKLYSEKYPLARYLQKRDEAANMAADAFLNSDQGKAVVGTPDERRATRTFVSQQLAQNGWNVDGSMGLPPFSYKAHEDPNVAVEQLNWFDKYMSEPTYAAASGLVKGTAKIGFGIGQLGSGMAGDTEGVQQYSNARQSMEQFMPQSALSKQHPYTLGVAEMSGALVPQVVAGWVTGPAAPLIMNGVMMGGDAQDASYRLALEKGMSPQAASQLATRTGLVVGGVTAAIDRFGPLQRILRSDPNASGVLKRWAVGTITGGGTGAGMQLVQEAAPYLNGLKEADRKALLESLENVKHAAIQGGIIGGAMEAAHPISANVARGIRNAREGKVPSPTEPAAGVPAEPPKVTLPDSLKPKEPEPEQAAPAAPLKLPDEAAVWGKDKLLKWAKANKLEIDPSGNRDAVRQKITDALGLDTSAADRVAAAKTDETVMPSKPPEKPAEAPAPADKVEAAPPPAQTPPAAPPTPPAAKEQPAQTPAEDPMDVLASDNFGSHPDEAKWIIEAMQKFPTKEGGIDGVKVGKAVAEGKFRAPPKIDHTQTETKPDAKVEAPAPERPTVPQAPAGDEAGRPAGVREDVQRPDAQPDEPARDPAIAALRKAGIEDAEAVAPRSQAQQDIADFADATGKRVVVVKSKQEFRAVNHPDHPDVVFVHEKNNNRGTLREAMAHELFDQLDRPTKDALRDSIPPHELKAAAREYKERLGKYDHTKERAAKITDAELHDEAVSLILGRDVSNAHVWRRLTQRHAEGFAKLTDAFRSLADRAAGKSERIDKALDAMHKGIEQAKPGPAAGRVSTMKTEELHVDPDRFQYKAGASDEGVVNKLEGVKYDPERAGVVAVWKDPANGKNYVVNGHHRYDLAKRNNIEELNVLHLDAKDAAEARLKGALINIGEGRGTATDAAKLFRDAKIDTADKLKSLGVSLSESKGREGLALAGLSDKLFKAVAKGEMPEPRGVAIGEAAKTHEAQDALADLLKGKGENLTNDQIRELGRMANSAPVTKENVGGLFGDDWVTKNHLLEKAKLSDYVRRTLRQDQKAFGSAARNADRLSKVGEIDKSAAKSEAKNAAEAEMVYNAKSTAKGGIADALNDGARRMAEGERFETVRDDVYDKVLGTLKKDPALKYLPGGAIGARLKALAQKHVYGDKTFIGEDLAPLITGAGRIWTQARQWFKRTFGPQTMGAEALKASHVFRENLAKADLQQRQAEKAFEEAHAWFEKQTDTFNNDFVGKVDAGRAQANKGLQDIADTMKELTEAQRVELFNLGLDAVKTWSEDYFGHIWKEKSKAKQVFAQIFGKSGSLEGSKAFLRERFYKLYEDGLAAGLTPKYPNPVDAFLHKYAEINRFIFARKSMLALEKYGMLRRVDAKGPGADVPDGWGKVNDRAFTIFGPPLAIKKPGGLQVEEGAVHTRGYVIAPEGVAQLINNVVTPSALKGSAVFEFLNATNQSMTQMALGFSGFHVFKVAKESTNLRIAQAIDAAAHGKAVESLTHLAKSPSTPAEAFVSGLKLQKAMLDPKLATPEQARVIDFLVAGGTRSKADRVYETTIGQKMMRAFKDGGLNGWIRGTWRIPGAIGERITRGVMSDVVQRWKLGVLKLHAADAMERLGPNPTQEQIRAESAKVNDHVDNVLGLMVRDNLFWNKTARDIGTLCMLSVGWNLGAKRALVGGVVEGAKAVKAMAQGKRPADTRRIAYLLSTTACQVAGGALATYLMTGERPKKLIDYIYPRTGKKDQSGHDIRINLGLYTKDYHDFLTHPIQTLGDKSSPILHTIYSVVGRNQDYMGVKIRNEDDAWYKQAADVAKYVGLRWEPFSVRGYRDMAAGQGSAVKLGLLPFLGFMPAKKEYSLSPAEKVARDIHATHFPAGGRTSEEADRAKLRFEFANRLRDKDPAVRGDLRNALKDGKLRASDIDQIKELMKYGGVQRAINDLKPDEAMRVFRAGDDEEKLKMLPIVARKLNDSKGITPEDRKAWAKELLAERDRLKPRRP